VALRQMPLFRSGGRLLAYDGLVFQYPARPFPRGGRHASLSAEVGNQPI